METWDLLRALSSKQGTAFDDLVAKRTLYSPMAVVQLEIKICLNQNVNFENSQKNGQGKIGLYQHNICSSKVNTQLSQCNNRVKILAFITGEFQSWSCVATML